MERAKVLLVDDEPEVILALGARLKAGGYEVLTAKNCAEAITTALGEKPDLVILDIGLPDGEGHEVSRALHENPETKSMPIVYLTARSAQVDMEAAGEVGAAGYLLKPFKSDDLLMLVKGILARAVT